MLGDLIQGSFTTKRVYIYHLIKWNLSSDTLTREETVIVRREHDFEELIEEKDSTRLSRSYQHQILSWSGLTENQLVNAVISKCAYIAPLWLFFFERWLERDIYRNKPPDDT